MLIFLLVLTVLLVCFFLTFISISSVKKASHMGRSYYGPPDYESGHYCEVFWFRERAKKLYSVRGQRFAYKNCCKGGKVLLPIFRQPPPVLVELLRFDGVVGARLFYKKYVNTTVYLLLLL